MPTSIVLAVVVLLVAVAALVLALWLRHRCALLRRLVRWSIATADSIREDAQHASQRLDQQRAHRGAAACRKTLEELACQADELSVYSRQLVARQQHGAAFALLLQAAGLREAERGLTQLRAHMDGLMRDAQRLLESAEGETAGSPPSS